MNDPQNSESQLNRPGSSGRAEDRLDELVAEYVDRLTAGEIVDKRQILSDHPDVGPDLLERLEVFHTISPASVPEPLGTLGDYTLRRRIGRGGMGVVYEAWEGSMDRVVALKVLPGAVAADDRAMTRFIREARVAGKLNHPNVVSVHGMGIKEQIPYYAMEFVDGETLAQLLERVKKADAGTETAFGKKGDARYFLNLAEAFADVADGLQHAHSRGVIHRDIKPSNLILATEAEQAGGKKGQLRILDFGLARLEGQESLTLSGDLVGTPLYMSPEQARRKKIPVDHRSDIYSLGATMYEAICGRPPFRGKDHADTLSQIIEHDPVEPRKVNPQAPPNLETIVLKCLRKDAGDRYGTAEALGQDLRRFVRGDPIEAREPGATELWLRRLRRHRAALMVTIWGALTLGLLGSFLWGMARTHLEARWASYTSTVEEGVSELEYGRFGHPRSRKKSLIMLEPEAFLVTRDGCGGASLGSQLLESALEKFDEAIAILPSVPDARYHRARTLYYLGRDGEASRELRNVIERAPDFAPASGLLALIESGSRMTAEARSLSSLAREWYTAHRALREADLQLAATTFDRLVEQEESGEVAYVGSRLELLFGRGLARLGDGRWLPAAEDMLEISHEWPGAVTARLMMGRAYLMLADGVEDAERIFHRALESCPPRFRDAVALEISRDLSVHAGDQKDAALRWVELAGDSCPVQREILRLFFVYMKYRNVDPHPIVQAIRRTETLLAEFPDSSELLGVLALVCAGIGEEFEATAREYINRALGLGADRPAVAFMAGFAYSNLGELADGERWHLRGIELDPHFAAAYGCVANIRIQLGDFRGAIAIGLEGISVDPYSGFNYLKVAQGHFNLGELEKALEVLESGLEVSRRSADLSSARELVRQKIAERGSSRPGGGL